MSTNRCANYSLNGHNFQTAAAISLLIDHLDDFETIRNEGTEDIIISLEDGIVVYAQAKSSYDENCANSIKYFKKSLISLSESSTMCNHHNLVHITNIKTMMGSKTERDVFPSGVTVPYESMGAVNQDLIRKYAPDDSFDFESFAIQFLKYTDKGGNKDEWIIGKLRDDFDERGKLLSSVSARLVYEVWVRYLNQNGADENNNAVCTRFIMVWGIIVQKIDRVENELYQESMEDYFVVNNNYSELVDKISGRFDIISRIIGNYRIEKDGLNLMEYSFDEYAEKHWREYLDIIESISADEIVYKKILKVLIQTVLRKMEVIRDVRKELKI